MPTRTGTILSRWLGPTLLLALVGLWAPTAPAQSYPITGNARFQIGFDPPIPATFAPAPNGRVLATPGATIQQTAGPDPKQITIAPGQLTAPATPLTIPLFLADPMRLEKQTSIAVDFPKQQATLKAGGRTGAPTVTFCAGQSVTPTGNPLCTGPAATGNAIHGLMRYSKTLNQFGGPAQPAFNGNVKTVLPAVGTPPCHFASAPPCIVVTASGMTPPTGAWGAPFGFFVASPDTAPSPGLFNAGVTPAGLVTTRTATGLGAGLTNAETRYGGPWTTGMLTISVTQQFRPTLQIFMLTGSDNRVDGVGTISLVAGAISSRTLNGPTADPGWLNMTVSAPSQAIPSLTGWSIGALALALAGVGLWRGRRGGPPAA